jgi:hypothetical protein
MMVMLIQWNKACGLQEEMLMVLYVIIYHSFCGICIASHLFIGIWSYIIAGYPRLYRYNIVYWG